MSADRTHEPDAVSLMAGLLLVLIAGLFLLDDLTTLALDDRWIWPGALILVGGVGLASTLRRGPAQNRADDSSASSRDLRSTPEA